MDGKDPLVRRAQAGDEHAYRQLFLRYRGDVARIVLRVIGPCADLDDVVQECFVQIFRSLHRFRGDAKLTTWIYRVVANVARMHLRAKRARPQLVAEREAARTTADARSAARHEQPDALALRNARLRALYAQLDRLSDKKRTVLVLHDFEGLSPQEIAQVVEAPLLTVRTRLFYARRELYAALARDPELSDLAAEALSPAARRGSRP